MKSRITRILTPVTCILLLGTSSLSFGDLDPGAWEFSLNIPYLNDVDHDFDGDASASIDGDFGLGVGIAYNLSERIALRSDISWNSMDYSGTRILDDGAGTIERIKGEMDTLNLSFGGDYYFTTGDFSPFINGNFGWSFIDTNIPNAPPQVVCWWDPWWGYICDGFQETRDENAFFYGIGAGLRFDLGRNSFIKAGYYWQQVDFDNASGSPDFDMIRIEFGVSY